MDTITSSTEISAFFSSSRRIHTAYIMFLTKQRDCSEEGGRVAFIAGKKNGNAVWRNASKRRMRAICRDLNGPWPGYDVVLLAKRSILKESYSKVLSASKTVLEKNSIIK